MRKAQLISVAAIVALGLTGCNAIQGLFSGGQDDETEDVTVADADTDDGAESADGSGDDSETGATAEGPETDADAAANGGEPTETGNAFTEPTVNEGPPVGTVPLDLITSTNPDTRAQQVQRDRPDPFSLLPATPTVEVTERQQPQRAAAPATVPGGNPGASALPGGGGASPGGRAGSPGGTSDRPDSGGQPGGPAASGDDAPTPPAPPPTTLARAVEVSGVVQIGAVPYAIVNAPNEPTSRYVRAGQSLSNGAVLVKRIEAFPGIEPVVVLEQNGIEIVRNIDGGSVPSDEEEVADTADASDTPIS